LFVNQAPVTYNSSVTQVINFTEDFNNGIKILKEFTKFSKILKLKFYRASLP